MIVEGNSTASPVWIQTQLADSYAWFLPIPKSELELVDGLEQNPFYQTTFK